ncbi:MAG: AAA family ATPase, partial [Spirochaetia bacterium]|nr:AAA family ATPase [Spirochaetia bacterium]
MGDVEIAGIKIPENGTSGISGTKVLSLALTRTTIHNLRKILHPLKLNLNLLLIGDAGIGKNTYINYINQIRRHPAIRYSFNEDTVPEDLIGSYRMHPDGVIRWEDGLLLQAMKTGSVFVADEMNLAQPETLKRFSSVFSENKITLYEGDGSEVRAENGFCFIATQNPQEGFEGRKHLPREIQKSFASVFLDSYPQEELLEILCSIYPSVPQKAFSCAVSVNQKVENSIRAGKLGIDDLESYHFNLRTLKRLGRRLELYQRELFQELIDLYILPFRSDEDRKFIFEIFTEEFSARADFEDELIQLNHFKETHFLPEILNQFSEKDEFSVSQPEIFTGETGMNLKIGSMLLPLNSTTDDFTKANFQELCRNFPPAGARKRALEASAAAIGAGENLLLECGDNVEAEEIIYFLCGILNKKIESIEFSGSMMTSDLIGSAKPEGEQIIWKDGPLTRAVKNGNQILFKNLETAGPEILEKLNMLTDDARALVLPAESGETKPVHLKNTAGIFAVKYFRKRRSEKTISRAFRNRFTAILIPPVIDAQGLIRTASFYFGFDHTPDFLDVFASFHLWIHTAASEKRIGSSHIHPYQFGLTNLKRWCFYISSCLAEKPQLDSSLSENQFREILIRGCEVSYINEIENEEERLQAKETLDQILSGTSGISEFISSLAGRSKYPESAAESKKKSRDT